MDPETALRVASSTSRDLTIIAPALAGLSTAFAADMGSSRFRDVLLASGIPVRAYCGAVAIVVAVSWLVAVSGLVFLLYRPGMVHFTAGLVMASWAVTVPVKQLSCEFLPPFCSRPEEMPHSPGTASFPNRTRSVRVWAIYPKRWASIPGSRFVKRCGCSLPPSLVQARRSAEVDRVLEAVNLQAEDKKRVRELSGGMRRVPRHIVRAGGQPDDCLLDPYRVRH